MTQDEILLLIKIEREHQKQKFGNNPVCNNDKKLVILAEEFGEIAKAVCQERPENELKHEVLQVAAVCVAWLENDLRWSKKS